MGGSEAVKQAADAIVESRNGALFGLAQVCLELSKGRLDRIEVGAIGRQVAELSSGRLDELAHLVELVGGQIVHDHDVAGRQRGKQALADILDKDHAVHRAIDDEGCRKTVLAQGGHEGHGLPMPPGNPADHPLATFGASIEPRHVGAGSRLIDEDKLLRIQCLLLGPPSRAPLGDVRSLLLGGVRDFF